MTDAHYGKVSRQILRSGSSVGCTGLLGNMFHRIAGLAGYRVPIFPLEFPDTHFLDVTSQLELQGLDHPLQETL